VRFPPRQTNHEGQPRSVGVELEFAAISVTESAEKVRSLFGGTVEQAQRHRAKVKGTSLGDFTCELDTRLAHSGDIEDVPGMGVAGKVWADFRKQLQGVLGDISSIVMPCEIVCPPIPLAKLEELDRLVAVLSETGVEGTRASPFFAFGAQLNPEIATRDAEWITSVLKAYLLMSDWLRAIVSIDLTRRFVSYADAFPKQYVVKVSAPDYWPPMDQLIEDYLAYNPTRNRELDMLPLFAWLDEKRVRRAVLDPRVKSRPTFHYRLPNADFNEEGWNMSVEWDRWCIVERLAENKTSLAEMGHAYRANRERFLQEDWALRSSEWLARL